MSTEHHEGTDRTASVDLEPFLPSDRLTIAEAAERLHVHPSTVIRWGSRGVRGEQLRILRVGGRNRVSVAELVRFLRSVGTTPSKPVEGS